MDTSKDQVLRAITRNKTISFNYKRFPCCYCEKHIQTHLNNVTCVIDAITLKASPFPYNTPAGLPQSKPSSPRCVIFIERQSIPANHQEATRVRNNGECKML